MAIVVALEPDIISFSKNPIIYRLQSDAKVDNPGSAAINEIEFKGTIADGTVVVLRWKGEEQRMVARNVVSNPGFEFPTGVVGTAYMNSILTYFKDNFYLDRDFTIEYKTYSGPVKHVLSFTAKLPGTTYNFIGQATPSIIAAVKTAGIDKKVKPNFAIWGELWVEKPDGGFENKFSEALQTDDSGTTEWDLSDLLHPELLMDFHNWEGREFVRHINSKRQYYIRYAEAWGERFQVGKITKATNKHVFLGGTPYESGSSVSVVTTFTDGAAGNDRAMRIGPDIRYVFPDEPQFLTFLNTRQIYAMFRMKVTAKVSFTNDVVSFYININFLQKYDSVTFNAGYAQLLLQQSVAGNAIERYTCQFFNGEAAVSRPYTFILDYSNRPYRRYFIYANSYGAFDTVRIWGKNSQEIELTKSTAKRFLSPDYQFQDGTFNDWDIQYRQRFEVATGYRERHEIRGLRDFHISRYKYRYKNSKVLPISVVSSSVREYEDGSNLIAQTFEYTYQFEDDTYAEEPEDLASQYSPPAGFQGAGGGPIVVTVPPAPGFGDHGELIFDPEPKPNSWNIPRSGGVFKLLDLKQLKLPLGDLGKFIRGDHTLGDFRTSVEPIISEKLPIFKQEEFPGWIQDETSSGRIAADETIDDTPGGNAGRQSGLYTTPTTSTANGWPVNGRKGTLLRIVTGEPGFQTGSDAVTTDDGKTFVRAVDNQAGNSDWKEIGSDARHPGFTNLPRFTVTKGVPFIRYIDLAAYKTSYHTLADLTVEINYNALKSKGVEIIKDGLLLTLTGKLLEDVSLEDDNILVYVADKQGNQTTLSVKIGTVETVPEQPEEPDTRPDCPVGPDFYGIPVVLSNHRIRFGFHGNGVPVIRIKFYAPGGTVAIRGQNNDLIAPDNGTATREIEFAALPAGPYDMSIEGHLCKSEPDIVRVIIPAATGGPAWFSAYPKFQGEGITGAFLTKVTGESGRYLTVVTNIATNTVMYSQEHDYVADITEISIPRSSGWPEANYRIDVAALTANVAVGNPANPTNILFKLVSGWNGAVIKDLLAGAYTGLVPAGGYNIYFQANDLPFAYKYCEYFIELKVGTVFTKITAAGGAFAVGSGTATSVLQPVRMFPTAGVDSRFILFNGAHINRFGEFRVTYKFRQEPETGTVVGTYQQLITFSELKIVGPYANYDQGGASAKYTPVIKSITYNGAQIDTLANRIPAVYEYSIDGGVSWGPVISVTGGWWPDKPDVYCLTQGTLENKFPFGTTRNVIIRKAATPSLVSSSFSISTSGTAGVKTAKVIARGLKEHIDLKIDEMGTHRLFNDNSTITAPTGFLIWNMLNGEVIKQPGALRNYVYDNYEPWSLVKAQIRIGEEDLYDWAAVPPLDDSAGVAWSHNCSFAFATGIFNGYAGGVI